MSCFVARAYWIGWIVLVQHVVCFFLFKDEFQWAFTRFHRTISVHGRRSSENSAKNSANAKHGSAALSVHVLRFPCTTSNRIASFSDTTDCCSYTPPSPTNLLHFFLAWIVLDSFRMGCEGWSSLQAIWFMEPIEIVMCSRRWLLSLSDFAVFISC